MQPTAIRALQISEHYHLIDNLMRALHINEKTLNHRTALWDDIATAYMRHIIAMQAECEGVCLVAYIDDNPAGFIFGYAVEQDDSRIEMYTGKELYVSDGYVLPEYRRRGIYKQLNSKLEAHFTANGVRRITRFTLVNNDGMRALLAGEGYEPTRILYEKWC